MSANKRPKPRPMTLAEQAVKSILESWGVACNDDEWRTCIAAVERAIKGREDQIAKSIEAMGFVVTRDQVLSAVRVRR